MMESHDEILNKIRSLLSANNADRTELLLNIFDEVQNDMTPEQALVFQVFFLLTETDDAAIDWLTAFDDTLTLKKIEKILTEAIEIVKNNINSRMTQSSFPVLSTKDMRELLDRMRTEKEILTSFTDTFEKNTSAGKTITKNINIDANTYSDILLTQTELTEIFENKPFPDKKRIALFLISFQGEEKVELELNNPLNLAADTPESKSLLTDSCRLTFSQTNLGLHGRLFFKQSDIPGITIRIELSNG